MEEKIKYRYFITGRSGTRQVYPTNGQKFALTYSENDERLDYKVTISDKLKFIGLDFIWLYITEKTVYRCEYLPLKIEKYCSGAWTDFFTGRISLNSGDPWNIDLTFVELSVLEGSNYECLDIGGDTDVNLFGYVFPRVSVSVLSGTIEREQFDFSGLIADPPPDLFPGESDPYIKGWSRSYLSYTYNYGEHVGDPDYNGHVEWVREVKSVTTGVVLDPPWIYISTSGGMDKYARTAILYNEYNSPYNPEKPQDFVTSYSVFNTVIDNGLHLRGCIEQFLIQICPHLEIESDFFQWNPTEVSTINYVTMAPSKVLNLIMFQKSDVKRPSNDNATNFTINLLDLVIDMCNTYQLKYAVTDNGKFKIEHVSYYDDRGIGLDTTITELIKNTRGNRVYSYDKDGIPEKETFKFMEASYGDFTGKPIVYPGSCGGQGDSKDKAYNVEHITTDVQHCISNPARDSIVSDDGFVLIAADVSNSILREPSILGGNSLNNTLAWAQLHRDYWKYNRPQKIFNMNGVLSSAITVKPTKLQADFTIPFCCDLFDPKLLVKTSLGNVGRVKSATYNMYTEKLTLSILHPADDGLIQNEKPITVGDVATTYKNYFVIIDVLSNDYDPDGSISPSTLHIEVTATHGTLEITPDFKVKYTPNTDYIGADVFLYSVKDNLLEQSLNTVVNISVLDGTPTIETHPDSYSIASTSVLTVAAPGVLSNDTGPSALVCIAETKTSTLGGIVHIFTDGSFNYTPPTTGGGPYSDSFTYTAKDVNDNMQIGTVNISVFDPQTVYVSLEEFNVREESIFEDCSTEGGGEGDEHLVVGEHTLKDFRLKFFSDVAKTVPLNVAGYGLTIKVNLKVYNHSVLASSTDINITPVTGTQQTIYTDVETSRIYTGCFSTDDIDQDQLLTLQPGTGYNI